MSPAEVGCATYVLGALRVIACCGRRVHSYEMLCGERADADVQATPSVQSVQLQTSLPQWLPAPHWQDPVPQQPQQRALQGQGSWGFLDQLAQRPQSGSGPGEQRQYTLFGQS